MANKLKNVFNTEPVSLSGNMIFDSYEASQEFHEALEKVFNEGTPIEVDGIKRIDMRLEDDKRRYAISEDTERISKVIIYPSKGKFSVKVDTKLGERSIEFERYKTNTQIITETSNKAIAYFKMVFNRDSPKTLFQFKSQPKFAKTLEEVIEALEVGKKFIKCIINPNGGDETELLYDLIEHIEYKKSVYIKLLELEKVLNIKFDMMSMEETEEIFEDINELYYLIVKRYAVKSRTTYKNLQTHQVKIEKENMNFKVGATLALTTTSKVAYDLINHKIEIYLSVVFLHAVIQDISEDGEGTSNITYVGTDTKPLIMTYCGFNAESEAVAESSVAIENIEKYIDAKTVIEYWDKEIIDIVGEK